MGSLTRNSYGDLMRWRFTFPQHGVIKDDLSHWLSNQPFDIFVTSSPDEHASIVDDDTPYTYTAREMRRTGLPRHDRLLRYARELAPSDVQVLLVMPTWRGGLVDTRASQRAERKSRREFRKVRIRPTLGRFPPTPGIARTTSKAWQETGLHAARQRRALYCRHFRCQPNIEVATADTNFHSKTLFSQHRPGYRLHISSI